MKGLSAFKHRSLYANIINDRAVPFYTAYISRTDPFVDVTAIDINYVPGYEDVILDSSKLASRKTTQPTLYESISAGASDFVSKAPLYLFFGVALPIGSIAYLVNSGVQSYRSAARIKLHEEGKAGISAGTYRLPLMVEDVRRRADQVFENMNARQGEDFIDDADQRGPKSGNSSSSSSSSINEGSDDDTINNTNNTTANQPSPLQKTSTNTSTMTNEKEKTSPTRRSTQSETAEFPTLALTSEQFDMIDSLDNIGFDKFAVHIHKAPHSHAAIVVRMNRQAFAEGKVVSRHWTERFEV